MFVKGRPLEVRLVNDLRIFFFFLKSCCADVLLNFTISKLDFYANLINIEGFPPPPPCLDGNPIHRDYIDVFDKKCMKFMLKLLQAFVDHVP